MRDDIELDGEDVRVGLSGESQERIALRLIGRVLQAAYEYRNGVPVHGLDGVCERTTMPLPHPIQGSIGNAGIAPALGMVAGTKVRAHLTLPSVTLPRPALLIEGTAA